MHTEQLKYLLDLKKTLSLSKTAENFFTSRQVINNAVKSLEEELHIKILSRTHTGVFFTDAGLLVCEYAQNVLLERQLLIEKLTPYNEAKQTNLKGKLEFYTIPRFSNKHFLKFFTNYCKKNHKLDSNLKTISASVFFKLLPIDNLFIFLTTAYDATLSSDNFCLQLAENELAYEIFSEQKLGICIAKNSPWMTDAQKFVTGQPSSLPFLIFNYSLAEIDMLQSNSITNNLYLADNFESQKQLIKTGNYLGMCTPMEFQNLFYSRDNSLIFLQNESLGTDSFYYIAIYSKKMQEHPVLQDVLASLKKFYC